MSSDTSPSDYRVSRESRPYRGADRTFDDVFSAVYEELRSLAAALKRGVGNAALATTDVVNEAYLRLENTPGVSPTELLRFKRAAARAMRQLLVRAARRHDERQKAPAMHPTEPLILLTLGHTPQDAAVSNQRVLGLDRAIEDLSLADVRKADILEMKYFGGLRVDEIAEILGADEAAIARDLRVAEAWLKMRLTSKA